MKIKKVKWICPGTEKSIELEMRTEEIKSIKINEIYNNLISEIKKELSNAEKELLTYSNFAGIVVKISTGILSIFLCINYFINIIKANRHTKKDFFRCKKLIENRLKI